MSRRSAVRAQAQIEAFAVYLAFVPHDGNSFRRKVTLIALLSMWFILEVGTFAYGLEAPVSLWWVRMLALATIARAQGVELGKLRASGRER